jgi:hypothetical protein
MAKTKQRGRPKKDASKSKGKKVAKEQVKRARQAKLPTMEDDKIDTLENLALDYAAIRDRRAQLTALEVPAKKKLLDEMTRLDRMKYKRDGISIERTVEKEGVRVRVKKHDEEDQN